MFTEHRCATNPGSCAPPVQAECAPRHSHLTTLSSIRCVQTVQMRVHSMKCWCCHMLTCVDPACTGAASAAAWAAAIAEAAAADEDPLAEE
jgi:hypothetical protein